MLKAVKRARLNSKWNRSRNRNRNINRNTNSNDNNNYGSETNSMATLEPNPFMGPVPRCRVHVYKLTLQIEFIARTERNKWLGPHTHTHTHSQRNNNSGSAGWLSVAKQRYLQRYLSLGTVQGKKLISATFKSFYALCVCVCVCVRVWFDLEMGWVGVLRTTSTEQATTTS